MRSKKLRNKSANRYPKNFTQNNVQKNAKFFFKGHNEINILHCFIDSRLFFSEEFDNTAEI